MYVIKAGGNYISIDQNSGGCPYYTPYIRHARWWGSKREAESYAQKFGSKGDVEWDLVKISISETPVPANLGYVHWSIRE